jgi:hypothetical protein
MMKNIMSPTAQSMAESMFGLPSESVRGGSDITVKLLIQALKNTTDNREEGIKATITVLVDMSVRGTLEELTRDKLEVIGKAKPLPWTAGQIAWGETALRSCAREAVTELERLLLPKGDESDAQVSAAFGLAIAFIWDLREVGYGRFCQGALMTETEIRLLNPPEPRPGEIN